MGVSEQRQSPVTTEGYPPGIPYIIGNEAGERFSFYGMKAVLVVFMTSHLVDDSGAEAFMPPAEASAIFHLFTAGVYLFPLLGAVLADLWFGKYRTILLLSVVYCAGHFALAVDETRVGLFLGLALIAIGSGGIKPCVSAHVGDQFGVANSKLLPKVFGWFYLSINAGAFVSSLLTPWLLEAWGPSWAFGVPGVFMGLATVLFWLGRRKFVHIPSAGSLPLLMEGVRSIPRRLLGVYAFVAVFWALFDQTGSSWVLQAARMNLDFAGVQWLPSQIQAVNPILILVLVPTFSYFVYPALERRGAFGAVRRIALGLGLAAAAFLVPAAIEVQLAAGQMPTIAWQLVAYLFLTAAEVLVSITCLELSYTQAPNVSKSIVMALYLLSIAAGNLLTSGINAVEASLEMGARGPGYFFGFAVLMGLACLGFVRYSRGFEERLVLQHSEIAS